jgi:hypothetical protein
MYHNLRFHENALSVGDDVIRRGIMADRISRAR